MSYLISQYSHYNKEGCLGPLILQSVNMAPPLENSNSQSKKKCVFVEIIDGAANMPYQVLISESNAEGKTDLELVIESMRAKKPSLDAIFKSRGYHFLAESEFKPGKWITIENDAFIEANTELRLVITTFPTFEMDPETQSTSQVIANSTLT